jgi:carboxylesterase type B
LISTNFRQFQTDEGMPVMVFLHGGGFVMQSAANYGDKQICRLDLE